MILVCVSLGTSFCVFFTYLFIGGTMVCPLVVPVKVAKLDSHGSCIHTNEHGTLYTPMNMGPCTHQ